jgi:hypothetical protein
VKILDRGLNALILEASLLALLHLTSVNVGMIAVKVFEVIQPPVDKIHSSLAKLSRIFEVELDLRNTWWG